jgi:hypothetical protein
MNFINLTIEHFYSEEFKVPINIYHTTAESDVMPHSTDKDIQPNTPGFLIFNVRNALVEIAPYAKELSQYALPPDLALQKSIELLGRRGDLELNLAAFQIDCFEDPTHEPGEVMTLVRALSILSTVLQKQFESLGMYMGETLSYGFASLYRDQLCMTKLTYNDANTLRSPAHLRAPFVLPARGYA